MIRRLWFCWILLGAVFWPTLAGWAVPRVVADHAKPTRTYHICLLLLRSQKRDVPYWNSDPWFLPVINRSPYKPAGWTLENPLASATLQPNADLLNSAIKFQADPKGAGATSTDWYKNGKAWGAPLTKDDPAYWTVQIDKASLDALADFDLLVLNGHSESTLTNDERAALRYLLERGATIWINNSQRGGNQLYNFFLDPPVIFQPGPYDWPLPANTSTWMKPIIPDHWLLSAYYPITAQETNYLRDNVGDKSFILSGVAGYTGGESSQVQEVVRLIRNNADGTVSHMGPSIAAGRVGNGLLILSGTDIMGAVADWFERKHNIANLRDLNVWPSNEAMHIVGQPNDHYIYKASAKLFFNMLARPASWHMVSGNAVASRTYDATFSATLTRSWTAGFTALGDPVSSGNYVALIGNDANPPAQEADELRLYRARKVTDDGGAVLDYPYGLYDDFQRKFTPTLVPFWKSGTAYGVGNAVRRGGYFYSCMQAHTADAASQPGLGVDWNLFWTLYPYGPFPNDATADSEMDLCFSRSPSPDDGKGPWSWIGAPVFGKITTGLLSRTVLYALQRRYNTVDNRWECQARAFAVDPFIMGAGPTQVGLDLWTTPSPVIAAGLPRVSLTLSNNRLVVTVLGKTNANSTWRIFVLDARSGQARAQVGGAPEIGANFRPTGPASMVTAQVEFEASDLEASVAATVNTSAYNPTLPRLRREVVEMLAVAGEYYAPSVTAAQAAQPTMDELTGGQAALFLIPPTFIFRSTNAQRGTYLSRVPADLTITDALGKRYNIGNPSSDFRRRYVLSVKAEPNGLKLTFRNWDAFFPQGAATPLLTLPLSISFTPERTVVGGGSAQSTGQVAIQGIMPAMGYPVLLRGTQRYEILDANSNPLRSTLRWFDGDIIYDNFGKRAAGGTFGFAVDAPPLVFRDALVVGTNTNGVVDYPGLKNSREPLVEGGVPQRQGGTVNAVRLRIPALSNAANPGNVSNWRGELAWQFHGDTHGPRSYNLQQWFWRSDFPYPAAASSDTVYATGLYHGYGDYEGGTLYNSLGASSLYRGMLYAINPDAPRYLRQTMAAGMVGADVPPADYDPTRTLLIDQTGLQDVVRRSTLRVGARILLKEPGGRTWDMGTVTRIREEQAGARRYWAVFDRPYDATQITPAGCVAIMATSVPFLSHVRAWNADTGEEPLRRYLRDGIPALRTSEGISSTPPSGESACPDNTLGQMEVMIAFNHLDVVCHEPWTVQIPSNTLWPGDNSNFLPADWLERNVAYLPRSPFTKQSNTINVLPELNYTVDARTGRIEMSPRVAGEFADRFVAVHYFTLEMVDMGGVMRPARVRHAEVMYVPSPVRWQYLFTDAIPDSGPTVVNDTVYISAIRRTVTGKWQPTLYAFAAIPADPLRVQPLWMQPMGATLPDTDPLPYRGITSPVPTPAGVLVGSALEGVGTNELALFGDRGVIIADGHRLIRANHDGEVVWQAAATKDFDPLALIYSGNRADQTTGVAQQEFTLVTRVQRLPNGNLLVCDTGANRVVELDREGTVVWQHPDGNLTYMDPDRKLDGSWTRSDDWLNKQQPNRLFALREVTPTKLRPNGPRDARRYYIEKNVTDPNLLKWDVLDVLAPGRRLGRATVRWEVTVIADTGNNRVLEIIRPLVRLDEADLEEIGALSYARGFQYRPDIYYMNGVNRVYLKQYEEVLANGMPGQVAGAAPGEQNSLIFADGTAMKTPLVFTAAMRYPGSDGQLIHLRADTDPMLDGVRTRELLVAVGNPAPDPANPTRFLRTAFIHTPGGTEAAVLGNYASLTIAAAAGAATLNLSYVNDLKVGDALLVKDPTNPDPAAVSVTAVTGINSAAKTITINPALDKNFPMDSRVVATGRWNALQIRAASPHDYARLTQLDLITLTTPAGGQEVRALVVDAAGVREVPLDPTRQDAPVFEMGQAQYAQATKQSALWEQMVDIKFAARPVEERTALKDVLTHWKQDTLFTPVAALRLDPGPGLTATDPRTVRYLISQMNATINPDPATWINGKAERRIHLFEARWFDMQNAYPPPADNSYGWRIIDSEWNYFLYPDPTAPGYPNLPGWTYPLSQPLSLARD